MKSGSMFTRLCKTAGVVACLLLIVGSTKADDKSASLYKAKCAVCHGAAGKGDSPAGKSMGVLSFSDPQVTGKSDAALKEVIDKGKNKMPAFAGKMTPEEIHEVSEYVLTLK